MPPEGGGMKRWGPKPVMVGAVYLRMCSEVQKGWP
jgi:hypothetical protein